jgi:branched-chain amino acid transport system substrate-binding protein
MRSATGAAVLFLMALTTSGCGGRSVTGTIYLGHVAPFSGKNKLLGDHARQGILLAVEQVNRDAGGIEGRRVSVLHVDSRDAADTAQADTIRLITLNRVAALVGGTDPAQAEAIGRAAQPYGVAVVTPAGLAGTSATDNLFSTGLNPAQQGLALARFVKDGLEPRVSSVLTVASGQEFDQVRVGAFAQELKGSSTRVEKRTFKSEADIPDLVNEAKETKPGGILIVGAGAEFVHRLRLLLQPNLPQVAWLYAGGEEQMTALLEDTRASQDVYLATAYVLDNGSARGKQFAEDYRKRFNQEPDVHAALAYDDARLLFDTIQRLRSAAPAAVREELGRTETFESVTGPVTFQHDHMVRRTAFIVQAQEGGPKLRKRDPGSP